jgi:hypothetical protein
MSNNQRAIQRQVVTIARNLYATGNNFTQQINLNFAPHDMVVRSVSYYPAQNLDINQLGGAAGALLPLVTDTAGIYYISSNLINTISPLTTFSIDDGAVGLRVYNSVPQTCFNVGDFVNSSSYNFSITNPFRLMGTRSPLIDPPQLANLYGDLVIVLEFVRYN